MFVLCFVLMLRLMKNQVEFSCTRLTSLISIINKPPRITVYKNDSYASIVITLFLEAKSTIFNHRAATNISKQFVLSSRTFSDDGNVHLFPISSCNVQYSSH